MFNKLATLALAGALCLAAQAPSPWPRDLSRLPASPPSSTTIDDVTQFERSMQQAAPYFATIQPNDYAANRLLVRHMATYLAGLQLLAHDPQMRLEVGRAQRIYNSLAIWSILGYANPSDPGGRTPDPVPNDRTPAASVPAQPPFPMNAPVLTDVPIAEQAPAHELASRYEADAGRAAGAWQNAENLRINLTARGMSLNAATSTSVLRLPAYCNAATESLRRHDWDEARTYLIRAESETEKIMKTVGR